MRAYIYTGGTIDPACITEHPKGEDLLIAADGGWRNAELLGEKPSRREICAVVMAFLFLLVPWLIPI